VFKLLIPFISVALTALWYPAMKPVFNEITPLQAATIEAFACFICASIWILIKSENIKVNKIIILIGLLNGLGSLMVYSSLDLLTPVDSSVLGRNYTIVSVLLAFLVLKENITLKQWGFILGSIIGSVLFVFNDSFGKSDYLGIIMVIGHTTFFSIANLLTKGSLKRISPVTILFYTKMITLVTLFPLGLANGGSDFINVNFNTFIYTMIISVFSMFIGMILYYISLANLKFSYVNVIRGSAPIFVYVYSIPFFNSNLTYVNLIGGVILILSIIYLSLENNTQQVKIKERTRAYEYGIK
jgi:drug/metabolite transporter (DMT)-like permease